MDLDEKGQKLVKALGNAINRAVERSNEVSEAIDNLRDAGYQIELTLRLEIGLRSPDDVMPPSMPEISTHSSREVHLNFTEEDVQTLRRMKIRLDD